MPRISRTRILTAAVVVVLIAAVPGAILRLHETGEAYLFSKPFFRDMVARLYGPGRLRFLFQPAMAILLGFRDGRHDAATGAPPFLWRLVFHHKLRTELLRNTWRSTVDLVCIAILLDVISQLLILHYVNPFAALLLGPILIFMPYCLSRTSTNRFFKSWTERKLRRA